MSTRLIHATHEGSHLYKFGIDIGDIKRLRADGVPMDMDWLPSRQSYGPVDHFFKFDHEVETWTMVKEVHGGSFVRNEKENPFKTDLPQEFEDWVSMVDWGISLGLIESDEEGDPLGNILHPFYDLVSNDKTEEHPYEFEVRDIGEITPCPQVPFQWEPLQPHESMVPSEMWHMGPVQIKMGHLRELFWKWVERNKEQFSIETVYPSQEGAIYFRARGGPLTSIHALKDPDFLALLGDVKGKDLNDLELELDHRMLALQDLMVSCSPTHQCPKCKGAGALPCSRCGGAGLTDRGNRAGADLKAAVSKVRQIKGSKGKDAEEAAVRAVEGLEKYFLSGGESE